jgi:hypothetical protein
MVDIKRALLAVTLAVTFAFAGSALAQGKKDQAPGQTGDIPGKLEAPGQTGDNPGQEFKTQRDDLGITDALPPGKEIASPPGEGVQNFGKSKKDEDPGE